MELKHLAAYLPYKLMVENLNFRIDYTGVKHSELTNLYCLISREGTHLWQYKTDVGNTAPIEKCKPILRNLSDLTKEIEVNGEKFVPIVELLKIKFKEQYNDNLGNKYCKIDYDTEYPKSWFKYMASKEISINIYDIENTEYWIIEKLKELHFDIFGLIEKGEAIDINTLNKTEND